VGARRAYDVRANWKIVVENYHECLHCPTVHPELVKIVPLYRSGEVEEDGQLLGNSMGHGLTSFTASGLSTLPTLPGLDEVDEHTFYGVYLFPNLILNYHSETVNAVTIVPVAADRTRVISEFLFRPETVAALDVGNGVYEAPVTLDHNGAWYLHVRAASLGANFGDQTFASVRVIPGEAH